MKEHETGTQKKAVILETPDQRLIEVESKHSEQKNLSDESNTERSGDVDGQDQVDKVLSEEFRWKSRSIKTESAVETCSTVDSSVEDISRNSEIDKYLDRNLSTGAELSELAIHTLLVETRTRDLDREVYQDPDSDRYLLPSDKIFDNAADDLETISVSKCSMSLLPQK